MASNAPSFDYYGAPVPESPVVLSVPHAGRCYPQEMVPLLKVPRAALTVLEDRHADTLVLAARGRETTLIQRRARAWIDLNRAEAERDPLIDDGAEVHGRVAQSNKLRSGLGLVPRRVAGSGDIWHRRLSGPEVGARITADHRPYHAALADALRGARARFGIAILLDIHSMPPLGVDADPPRIILGDRFGRTAAARFVGRVEAAVEAAGIPSALNAPYAGGHIIDRHARPGSGIHAIQIEIDRSLYLDAAFDLPGAGFARTARMLTSIVAAVADEAASMSALAAE